LITIYVVIERRSKHKEGLGMRIYFPALESLEKPGGLFVLLSRLGYMRGKSRPKYSCGHGGDLISIYRPPKALLTPLAKRGLLGNTGAFEDVVIFDYYGLYLRASGYVEKRTCPKCFFEKLILDIGPLCPVCRKIIRKGSRIYLLESKNSDKRRLSNLVKLMYVAEAKKEWMATCCSIKSRKQYDSKRLIWDGHICNSA